MDNVVVTIEIEGHEPFKYNHFGSEQPIKIRIEPETSTVWLMVNGQRLRFDVKALELANV